MTKILASDLMSTNFISLVSFLLLHLAEKHIKENVKKCII